MAILLNSRICHIWIRDSLPKQDLSVKEFSLMKGRVEAYLSIFSKVYDRMDHVMLDVFVEYGATLLAPLDVYIEKLSPLSTGAAEIIQQRLFNIRQKFVEASKQSNRGEILKVFEDVRRLYDDLELVLTAVEDTRKRNRSPKI